MDSHSNNKTYHGGAQTNAPAGDPRWQVVEREEFFPTPQEPPQKGRWGWRVPALLVAVALVCLGGLQYYRTRASRGEQPPTEIDLFAIELTAAVQDADGVQTDSSFTLSSPEPLTKDEVASLLRIEPSVELAVEKATGEARDGGRIQYTISPKEELRSDTVYNLYLSRGDEVRSFAFQTKTTFALPHFMPQGAAVPVDSGIELRFTGGNPAALEQSFSITPALAGHFERVRDSYVYVHEGMEYDTFYTVTVAAGLQSEGGMELAQPVSFSFRTTAQREDGLFIPWRSSQVSSVLPDRVPAIFCYPPSGAYDLDYDVTVYRYADQGGYLEALRTLYDYEKQLGSGGCTFPTGQAALILTFTDRLKQTDDGGAHLLLPDTLEPGYYLIKADCEQSVCSMQQLVQVSDVAVYLIAGEGKLAVWANSAATGEPLAGVTVLQDGYSRGVTNQDGLAVIETPHTDTRETFSYLSIDVGATPYLLDSMAWPDKEGPTLERKYYMALYTDRSAYLPGDTVQFWGVVQPRVGSVGPKKVKVMLCAWNSAQEGEWPYTVLDETQLEVGDYGVFSGAFSFEDLAYGYYNLAIEIEGEKTFLGSVGVTQYEKPAYLLEVSSDRAAYDIKESARVFVNASFYDGTPAQGLSLIANSSNRSYSYTTQELLATDAAGNASFSVAQQDEGSDWRPFLSHVNITNAQAEDSSLYASHEVIFLPRDRMLEASPDEKGAGLTLSLHEIDRAALEKGGTATVWEPDAYRGAALNGEVTCTVRAVTWHRTLEGTKYDFIEKKNINRYSYYTTEETLGQVTLQTMDGKAHLDLTGFELGEDSYFAIEAATLDGASRRMTESIEFYPQGQRRYTDGSHYGLRAQENAFVPGESIPLTLVNYGNEGLTPQGRVLLAPVSDNLDVPSVQSAQSLSVTFAKEQLPTAWVYGAYFDGRDIYALNPAYFVYDQSERELTVTVTPDAARYAPGDEVTLDISVIDAMGRPVQAQVLVSVVDEAALAVWENPADLLSDLFAPVYDANVRTFVSYDANVGGEGGGGGDGVGELVRSDFCDNPAFLTLSTSSKGTARATFTLADSLTSWRITALAVTEGALAGETVQTIEASLPFFVSLLSSDCYVEGDELSISLRGFGEDLSATERVAFAAELTREGQTSGVTRSGSGLAGDYVNLSFGRQKAGRYRLLVSGKSASHTDAMEVELTVADSVLQTPVVRRLAVEELRTLKPLRYPVTLSVCEQESAFYWSLLTELASSGGARAERRIASSRAAALLLELAPELGGTLPQGAALPDVQDGISPLPTMSADVLLTAKAAMAAPELLNDKTTEYFWRILSSQPTADDAAAAYLGLAALRQPVLRDIRTLLAQQPKEGSATQPLTDRQRLILVAALAAIGDEEGAARAYEEVVRPQLVRQGELLCLEREDAANQIEDTGIALLTASVAAPDDAAAMARYLHENESDLVLTCLEQLFYVLHNKPASSEPLDVKVTMAKEQQTLSLGRRGMATLQLTKNQLETLTLEPVQGEQAQKENMPAPALTLLASYVGGADQLPNQERRLATLTKTITSVEGGEIAQSALLRVIVRVSLEGEAPQGCYLVSDAIPAGMRFVHMPESYLADNGNSRWQRLSQEGQRLSFCIWYDGSYGSPETELVYYVRAVLPGSFVSEAPILTHEGFGLWGTGERGSVVVQ